MKQKHQSRTSSSVKKGALVLAILAAFLALVLLLVDAIPITGPEPVSPVLSILSQILQKVPYLIFLLSIFAMVSVVYYFMINIAKKIENITLPIAHPVSVQEFEADAERGETSRGEKTNASPEKAVEKAAVDSEKDSTKHTEMNRLSVEQMLDHLDDKALGGLVEKIIERNPDILTPGLLDKMIEHIRKKGELKGN